MSDNQPITNVEVFIDDNALLVSKTDLTGSMTYVNKDFADLSGFPASELLGQPQTIVRHPDMPEQVFADLWRDLKDGRPWCGLLKNRCKNGDYYWARANVAPIRENGRVVGYVSLLRKASPQQILAVGAAYVALRNKRATGRMIWHGAVVADGMIARVRHWFADISASRKLVLSLLLILLLTLGLASQWLSSYVMSVFADRGRETVERDIDLIQGMVHTNLQAQEREAKQISRSFDLYFPEGFSLAGSAGTPLLRYGKSTIFNGNFDIVDRFAAKTGAIASVYLRQEDDFLAISTSLKQNNGEPAPAPSLGREDPVSALLLAGKSAVRRASLQGKTFLMSYQPILSGEGKVIGASAIGLDISSEQEALKKEIRSLKIGDSGYYYILDAAHGKTYGNLLVHPAKEGGNILAARDAAGHEFVREMLDRKSGEIIYPWINTELGETRPRDKIVVFRTLPDEQWLIAGGTYLDEFRALSGQISRYVVWGGLLLSLVLVVLLALLIRRLIVLPLQQKVLPVFARLAEGDYDNLLDVSRGDEVGKVVQGLQSMQIQQGFNLAETQRLANDNLRIRSALDCARTNLWIANDDGTVVYANHSLLKTLQQIEPRIREQWPAFAADQFVGSNIGTLYREPAAVLKAFRELQASRLGELKIGARIYHEVINPIINDRGQRLGTVGEWTDWTAEVTAQHSLAQLVERAAAGDLEARLDTEALEGFYRQLGKGINSLLETSGRAFGEIAGLLERIAKGDLTQTLNGAYHGSFAKLCEDANRTVARLRELVGEIQVSADTINTASREIASGNQNLSSRTEEQAGSLEETASSMEQLSATVRHNADSAKQANELAIEAQRIAEQGGDVVGQVVVTMGSIHQASSRIADIIGVIDSIAFQTNILALNAAVEAARAGEQGRGFAVVATEVRSLAQRSAAAAKEIKGLISESVERVESGNQLVDQAGQTMTDVVASIKRVARIMADISAASREQSSGIGQITVAITQMDEVTQQNAALVEEAAAAAASLEAQARQLQAAVSVFVLGGEAHRPQARLEGERQEYESRHQASSVKRRLDKLPTVLDDEWEEF